jgi:hypothetical protein
MGPSQKRRTFFAKNGRKRGGLLFELAVMDVIEILDD